MPKFNLYTDKNGNIATSEVSDPQTFFLNKDAVTITAENIEIAKEKYRELQTNNFMPKQRK